MSRQLKAIIASHAALLFTICILGYNLVEVCWSRDIYFQRMMRVEDELDHYKAKRKEQDFSVHVGLGGTVVEVYPGEEEDIQVITKQDELRVEVRTKFKKEK